MSRHWDELIEALTLLKKGADTDPTARPTHCEHDELWVLSDPRKFSQEELHRLSALGFFPDGEGGFKSFRFGSA